jgi:Amt family ammonium transporter
VQRVRHAPVDASLIGFEITETAAVVHMDNALTFIRSLQELGVSFALDDFGAGLSSFGYLRSLPVDTLKVDGQFVRNLANSALDRGIVAAINQIAHVMGMETVAEFVEDEPTVQQLDHIGIDYLQGYHLGRPQPLEHYLSAVDPATAHGVPSERP